jgi:hypothetical protein
MTVCASLEASLPGLTRQSILSKDSSEDGWMRGLAAPKGLGPTGGPSPRMTQTNGFCFVVA